MKKFATLALMLCFGFGMVAGFTGCEETPADKAAEDVREKGDEKAEEIRETGDKLDKAAEEKADKVEEKAEEKADAIEESDDK